MESEDEVWFPTKDHDEYNSWILELLQPTIITISSKWCRDLQHDHVSVQ